MEEALRKLRIYGKLDEPCPHCGENAWKIVKVLDKQIGEEREAIKCGECGKWHTEWFVGDPDDADSNYTQRGKVELPRFKCKRCGHSWHPRKPQKPRVCPKCKSPYWDTPRGGE